MDHYFILLYEDSLPVEDQIVFVDYLKSLIPNENEKDYCMDFAPHVSPVLNRTSTYVANINISSMEFMEDSWIEVHGTLTYKNIFPASFEKNHGCSPHILEEKEIRSISEIIHTLADQLPQHGTYHLDVILSHIILENVDINQHFDLAGALHRLNIWHHAIFSIISQSILLNGTLQDWSQITNAQIVSKMEKTPYSALFWRGSLSFKHQEMPECERLERLQLSLDTDKLIHWFALKDALGVKSKHLQNNSTVILSSHIELLDECCISTIPPYMFSPVTFLLTAIGDCEKEENISNFLQYLNSKAEICLVLRLSYSFLTKPVVSNNLSSFHQWKKAVADGNVNSPECHLESDREHVILIANKHPFLPAALSVYLLNDSSQVNANFPLYVLATNSLQTSLAQEKIAKKCEKAFSILSHCSSKKSFFNYLGTLKKSQMEILIDYIRQKKEECPERNTDLTAENVHIMFNLVQEILNAQLKFEKSTPLAKQCQSVNSGECDSWDWPERSRLLQKQIEADKATKIESLTNHMPPQQKTIVITAKDVGNYFNELGESKTVTNAEVLLLKANTTYINYEADRISEQVTHDMLSRKFHDVYYNYNQNCEEEEIAHAKMKDCFVVQETASTCCNVQLAPNYTVLPSPGISRRNHSTRSMSRISKRKQSPSKIRRMSERTRSSSKNQMPNLSKAQKDISNSQQLLHSRRYSVPLRRSPRKHPAPTVILSNKRKNVEKHVSSKQEDLSERHRMKLREAVVIALEKHEIDLNHSMFKPCARKLFAVCKPFVKDIIGKGSTSSQMQRIAAAHAKQVVEFEMQKRS